MFEDDSLLPTGVHTLLITQYGIAMHTCKWIEETILADVSVVLATAWWIFEH